MKNTQQAKSSLDFDAGPILNMYLASFEAWKNNYDALVQAPKQQTRQNKPDQLAIASYDGAPQLQKTGENLFRRLVELQIELCRFVGKRWEQYLDLPSNVSRCRSAADIAQLQSAFLTKMAADYDLESRKFAEAFQQFVSNLMAHQQLPANLQNFKGWPQRS